MASIQQLPIKLQIVPESFDVHDVILNNKITYNTNNHWIDNKPPNDYDEISTKTNTKNWVHLKEDELITEFDIDLNKYKWLLDANQMGIHSKLFPNAYLDELDSFLKDYEHINNFQEPMFVRTENVSLKGGQHGVGPYLNMKMIIESFVTCTPGHSPLDSYQVNSPLLLNNNSSNKNDAIIHVYLFKWNYILKHEYRVFIYKHKLTCISQQHVFDIIESFTSDLIDKHCEIIYNFFNNKILSNINFLDSYSIDVGICDNDEAFFIEINPFGAEYSSGSALFHWINDDSKLCSDGSIIYFRYTK